MANDSHKMKLEGEQAGKTQTWARLVRLPRSENCSKDLLDSQMKCVGGEEVLYGGKKRRKQTQSCIIALVVEARVVHDGQEAAAIWQRAGRVHKQAWLTILFTAFMCLHSRI